MLQAPRISILSSLVILLLTACADTSVPAVTPPEPRAVPDSGSDLGTPPGDDAGPDADDASLGPLVLGPSTCANALGSIPGYLQTTCSLSVEGVDPGGSYEAQWTGASTSGCAVETHVGAIAAVSVHAVYSEDQPCEGVVTVTDAATGRSGTTNLRIDTSWLGRLLDASRSD